MDSLKIKKPIYTEDISDISLKIAEDLTEFVKNHYDLNDEYTKNYFIDLIENDIFDTIIEKFYRVDMGYKKHF